MVGDQSKTTGAHEMGPVRKSCQDKKSSVAWTQRLRGPSSLIQPGHQATQMQCWVTSQESIIEFRASQQTQNQLCHCPQMHELVCWLCFCLFVTLLFFFFNFYSFLQKEVFSKSIVLSPEWSLYLQRKTFLQLLPADWREVGFAAYEATESTPLLRLYQGNSDCFEINEKMFTNFCRIRIELQSDRTNVKPVRFSCKFQGD